MILKKLIFCVVGGMVVCTFLLSAESAGFREEYIIPFKVESGLKPIPINAVISCQVLDINKRIDQIKADDNDYILFFKYLVESISKGEISTVKKLSIYDGWDEGFLDSCLQDAVNDYAKADINKIELKKVIFIEDAYSLFFVFNENDEAIEYRNLTFIKNDGGELIYELRNHDNELTRAVSLANIAVKYNLENPLSVDLSHSDFDNETVISPRKNHENYVSVAYNDLSFSEGIPVTDESANSLLRFVGKLWETKINGTLEDFLAMHNKESAGRIRHELKDVGEKGFTGEQHSIKAGYMYSCRRLTYAIKADPFVFVYYDDNDGVLADQVLYRGESGYQVIRYNSFDGVRSLFKEIAEENIQQKSSSMGTPTP